MLNVTFAKYVAAIGVVAGSFLLTNYVMDRISPLCPAGEVIELKAPFIKSIGWGYVKEGLSVSGDGPDGSKSKLVLCEGNSLLAPGHSAHAEIAKDGRGRYSHWVNSIVFSTSDNSDPNKNGRAYVMVVTK